ncbi:hypothetical protein EZS27_007487 [termite gut metagenome]|uniref:Uncharacterized protein n=4 Tax=termite gut metagenome TaxID=433724 RepID=A0A5J4SHU6_9ZZZZ
MHLEKGKKDCSFDKRVVYLIVLQMIKYNEQSHTKLRINSEGIDKDLLPHDKFQTDQATKIIRFGVGSTKSDRRVYVI